MRASVKYNGKEVAGKLFNEWTIIEDKGHKNGSRLVLCECSCGNRSIVYLANVIKGKSKGCSKCVGARLSGHNNGNWKGCLEIPHFVFYRARSGADVRKIPFEITIEDMALKWEEQRGICALSGVRLELPNWSDRKTASLDRKVQSEGYTKENIQWVHKDINRMKNKFSDDYFIEMCKLVAANREL